MTKPISASKLGRILACQRMARLDETGPKRRATVEMFAGILVHKVFEVLAGQNVPRKLAFATLEGHKGRHRQDAVELAESILAKACPIDLRAVTEAEVRFDGLPVGRFTARGVVDRVSCDVFVEANSDSGKHVVVADYKSGALASRAELEAAPQTILYLHWAQREYFPAGVPHGSTLTMVYLFVAHGGRIVIPFDAQRVMDGIKRIEEIYGGFLASNDPPASTGRHCEWCNHRAACPALRELVLEPAALPEPWDDLPMPELVELRQQVSGDVKLLEHARKGIDQAILDRLDGERWEGAGYTVKETRRRSKSVPASVLPMVADVLGLPLGKVLQASCKPSLPALRVLTADSERAAKVLDLHTSTEPGAQYLTVRSRGGLF